MTTTETNWAEKIGKPTFDALAEMVAAIGVDWDRLEELKEARAESASSLEADDMAEDDVTELDELEEAAGDCEDEYAARERIQEDPLSIEVGGWWSPGAKAEASEFRILLGTGGPATRIVGDLDEHSQPTSARLEVQDWFKPWTQFNCDEDILLAYCQEFYFGE